MVEYDILQLQNGRIRKLVPDRKFNRKTFDPYGNDTDRAILNSLRTPGRTRYMWLRDKNDFYCSPSLRYLLNAGMCRRENEGECYVDFACGESADRFIAHRLGYQSSGMDLFPPVFIEQETKSPSLIVGDIAEPLPFADYTFTYATCHAAIALLLPKERAPFYEEVYRCMKIGGTFVLCGLNLKNGYGFDLETERSRILTETKFEYVCSIGYGVVVRRD